jgi:hypothetical protein
MAKGFDVILTADEIARMFLEAEYCPICGVLMVDEASRRDKENWLKVKSLDRIYNETVMRKDNVQIICLKCNQLKGTKV